MNDKDALPRSRMSIVFTSLRGYEKRRSQASRRRSISLRPARRSAFQANFDSLENRLTPTGNIAITNALVVGGNGQPLAAINVGEVVSIEADFTTQDLPGDASYIVGFTVNGLTKATGTITWGAGSSGTNSFYAFWGGFIATPGTNQVTVTVDPDRSVPETSYADNAMSFTFVAGPPVVGSLSYTVAQVRAAYDLGTIPGFGSAMADGSGQTIALDEAGNDPSVITDLDGFDNAMRLTTGSTQTIYQQYGPASSIVNVYNLSGVNITALIADSGNEGVPAEDPTGHWEAEESLDVEWAHAMAPGAKIDIIEVNDDTSWTTNLLAGDKLAAGLPGVSVVSNSWGLYEWSGETAYDSSTFVTPSGHTGVTFLTASNDNGANVYTSPPSDPAPSTGNDGYYPATSPNVVSVGGTQLTLNSNTYGGESGWSFPAPSSTVDNGSSSYTQSGSWSSQSGGFSGTYSTAVGGSSSKAVWTIPITPANTGWGTELSATWTASPSNATNATYTVYDGTLASGTILGTVVVNQSAAPVGTALGSFQFQEMGVFFPTLTESGTGTLTVVLDASSANSRVVADAIGSAQAWASTGGPTSFESEPAYQLPFQNTRQRTTPDVAFDGSENTGVTCVQNGELTYGNFGTSLSSPCWAGLIAIANQGRVASGGTTLNSGSDPTQTLQALYSLPAGDFHDITSGYNGFNAGPGYDEVTGLGSPVANLLIPGLVSYARVPPQLGRLIIAVQPPASVATGSAFSLTVTVEDGSGNLLTNYNSSVAISLDNNPGAATLGGRLTAPVNNGVATFSGLTLNKPGTGYTLRVSGGSLAPTETAPFNVSSNSTTSPTPTSTPAPTSGPATTPPPAQAPARAPTAHVLATQTLLKLSSRSSRFGQPVKLTAKIKFVGKSRMEPTGSVTFNDGSTILATVPLQGGGASFTTSTLPIGKKMIRAAYDGSPNAKRSKSPVVFETIRAANSKTKAVKRSVRTAVQVSGFTVPSSERFGRMLARDESDRLPRSLRIDERSGMSTKHHGLRMSCFNPALDFGSKLALLR
jgi:Bacterial Ig-like domain (group 3)